MNRSADLAVIAFLFCLSGLIPSGLVKAAEKPNVVIVITDDQGYGDLSCTGNPILRTPEIDKLYAESIRLKDFHVAPTCSPTRCAFLTGHWTNRTGVGQTPDYWDNAYFDGSYWHNGKSTPVKGFCTDVFFDYAKRFIKMQKEADQPFLAYIATNAPHAPMHSPEEYSEPYKDLNVNLANFFGMIANIDQNVGQLRAFLEAEGLLENTIFIFTTDNGTSTGDQIFNAGMRGKKGSPYDGGHRVPFFLYWPAGELVGGRDVEPITAYVDVLPTLIDLCKIPAPEGVKFDGTSIVPLLRETASDWPDRILVTDSQRVKDPIKWRQSAVMTSQYRLNNQTELYDIKADPGQTKNIAPEYPDVVRRLTEAKKTPAIGT